MSLATLYSRACCGIAAPQVTVEVHLANGLPSLAIVGLPETAVKESRERVRAALLSSGFEFPARRVTINLAPADLPKQGGRYDLAIALGILAASGQLKGQGLNDYEIVGELALTGEIRPVSGILPLAMQSRRADRTLILPADNAEEAALIQGLPLLPVRNLLEVCAHLNGSRAMTVLSGQGGACPAGEGQADLADIHGQHHAKRALEIAAAGGHSLLMIGPPGTGKTMLASRLPGILPPMSEA
ncbi:MAG: magnesium chelatase domain-containing protein, partial [Gammaproteobacteria bacterium]